MWEEGSREAPYPDYIKKLYTNLKKEVCNGNFILDCKDPGGIIITILIGIAGAFVGGFIGSLLGLGTVTGFNIGSFLLAIAGAILLLVLYRFIKK